jgi:hypothetical protein
MARALERSQNNGGEQVTTLLVIPGEQISSPIEVREDGGMIDFVQDGEIVEFSPQQFARLVAEAKVGVLAKMDVVQP